MADTTTNDTAQPISLYTWGVKGTADYCETPVQDIPTVNLSNLGLQGYRHKLGNEVAAKVAAKRKTDEGKAMSEDEILAYSRQCRAEMLDKIVNGTLGVRAASGAPRLTGEEAIRHSVTLESLKKLLKKYNLALPTGDDEIAIAGKQMTRAQLIEAEYRRSKADIEAEVTRRKGFDTATDGDLGDLVA